jgi:hypothetical protein
MYNFLHLQCKALTILCKQQFFKQEEELGILTDQSKSNPQKFPHWSRLCGRIMSGHRPRLKDVDKDGNWTAPASSPTMTHYILFCLLSCVTFIAFHVSFLYRP